MLALALCISCHVCSPRGIDPLLSFTYTIVFVWLIVGSVWFFTSPAQSGRCGTLRDFGIAYCAIVLGLLVLVCIWHMFKSMASVRTYHAPSPVRNRACQTASDLFENAVVPLSIIPNGTSNQANIITPSNLSSVSPVMGVRSPQQVHVRARDDR